MAASGDLLFEYLRGILYDPHVKSPAPEALEEPYRKLYEGLCFLHRALEEARAYSAQLAAGNLSAEPPPKENTLCDSLKSIHANLNHLTWQAEQVAGGDYSQRVSYLGEFSRAFNTMTEQLGEREERLRGELEAQQAQAELLQSYNDLLMTLSHKRREWILVVDAQTRDILYCNKVPRNEPVSGGECVNCEHRLDIHDELLAWQSAGQESVWERQDRDGNSYLISTYPVEWQGKNAYAHIVTDVTAERRKERSLENKAYCDPFTGLYNRRFFEEFMIRQLRQDARLTFCYLDIDGLKSVNDQYGHAEGDEYIRLFVDAVGKSLRERDVFARIGGDEFCVVFMGHCAMMARERMEKIRQEMARFSSRPYGVSFSYGVVEAGGAHAAATLPGLIREADREMYAYKRQNRKKRPPEES